ncbi:MAG: ATP-dependent Clp protease adaptor ClpS [Bradyrhizobium sp.]|nr:ATP-dependent Clp protease adaptor ClpS [Bradyrhizobium sp.]
MMDVVSGGAGTIRLVFHDDEATPHGFVVELLRSVFGKTEREAVAFLSGIDKQGKVACGPYPAAVANALLAAAREQIRAGGFPLLITSEAVSDCCDLCGATPARTEVSLAAQTARLCAACVRAIASVPQDQQEGEFRWAWDALAWHFAGISQSGLVTTVRQFPGHMRADVQVAIDTLFAAPIRFFGFHEEYRWETPTFTGLMRPGRDAPVIAPPQYHEIDIGEDAAVQCLRNGLWLCRDGELRYAVVLSLHQEPNQETAIRLEIAVPTGSAGQELAQRCFAGLEEAVRAARSYRGKILSLDGGANYRGRSRGVMVHRLPPVDREAVILPEQTLRLLDRNVRSFVGSRASLRRLGQSTRKGILLYGPPGTGKTHTIRYLATNLPGHTTLIITAEQVALLGMYMNLARLLQPALVVIEDVDLIARDRNEMAGPCEESLLNKLLNEMDGLKEDADILFVLTTNRPEQLEAALAGRPGRIDQAIEVPLPDRMGRDKLVRLYGKGLPLDQSLVNEAVARTEGVSAAFIKELMRRIAQAALARDAAISVVSTDIDEALDDMLFAGGQLNVKLLGGAQEMVTG